MAFLMSQWHSVTFLSHPCTFHISLWYLLLHAGLFFFYCTGTKFVGDCGLPFNTSAAAALSMMNLKVCLYKSVCVLWGSDQ